MASKTSAPKGGTRSIRLADLGLAIICTNEAQMLYINGFSETDPGGDVIWDWASPSKSLKLSTAASRELFARQVYAQPLAPKGVCYVRVELQDGFLVGKIGDEEVFRISTKSQVNKASAKSARLMAKGCGMSEEDMKPMFAYPTPAEPVTA